MSECIVCKGYYNPAGPAECQRCHSDNKLWATWQQKEKMERGGFDGLLAFIDPFYYSPIFVTVVALGLGLVFWKLMWKEIRIPVCMAATTVGVIPSGMVPYLVYDNRRRLRENELLARLRNTLRKRKTIIQISQQLEIALMALTIFAGSLLLVYALIKLDTVGGLLKWLIFEPEAGAGSEPPADLTRLKLDLHQALPLIHMIGYAGGFPLLNYLLSILAFQQYAQKVNAALPLPIFMQGDLLAKVVRREAEIELGRLEPRDRNVHEIAYGQWTQEVDAQVLRLPSGVEMPAAIEGPLSRRVELWRQTATWVWDELARTNDGGIEMRVARQEIYQLPQPGEGSGHRLDPRVRYVVRADPWGRITSIKRDEKPDEKSEKK